MTEMVANFPNLPNGAAGTQRARKSSVWCRISDNGIRHKAACHKDTLSCWIHYASKQLPGQRSPSTIHVGTTSLLWGSLSLRSTTGLLVSGTSESEEESNTKVPLIADQSFVNRGWRGESRLIHR